MNQSEMDANAAFVAGRSHSSKSSVYAIALAQQKLLKEGWDSADMLVYRLRYYNQQYLATNDKEMSDNDIEIELEKVTSKILDGLQEGIFTLTKTNNDE